ncbi:transcription factor UNE12 [Olea europaea subsp. europaea]|uniref:Transcription factor UNE12 n=1 Tax=Olea europaea subsp. europaea TaxID=158383 RepID=A0A8S0Q6V2_OLEEU|nr:transcription factor UNE12 [Olea europaea subsp. europaea]
MANNPGEATSDDFLEQILRFPAYTGGAEANMAGNDSAASLGAAPTPMMLQLSSGDCSGHLGGMGVGIGSAYGGGAGGGGVGFPLGLSLEQGKGGFMKMDDASGSGKRFRDNVVDSRAASSVKAGFRGQPMPSMAPSMPHSPAIRPRVRARRGQATDPHSIAERVCIIVSWKTASKILLSQIYVRYCPIRAVPGLVPCGDFVNSKCLHSVIYMPLSKKV